jgi:hypothetical protein
MYLDEMSAGFECRSQRTSLRYLENNNIYNVLQLHVSNI